METHPLFSIDIELLTNFGPRDAVRFFRKLLWAEAGRVGISGHLIDVPECINVGDGGVDACIENAQPSIDEVIPQGTTAFQIKAADLQPKECKTEIHQNGNLSQPLKPEIRRILDNGGNYVMVLFADITPQTHHRRKVAIEEEFNRLGYHNKVRVYSASQLIEFANRHIPLIIEYKGFNTGISYSNWSKQRFMQIPATFVIDDQRADTIKQMRKEVLGQHDQTLIFRVTGLSGIGKTRLVYEALNIDGIKQIVVYVDADYFLTSDLFIKLQNDPTLGVVLVVDECSIDQHDQIVRAFSGSRPRLCIITISYDKRTIPPPTKFFNLQPLAAKEIRELIDSEFPSLLQEVAYRLTRFADGFPRIAVLLGESYLEKGIVSHDVIRITDSVLMDRLLGVSRPLAEHDRKIIWALRAVSIFGKVGFEGSVSSEAEWLADFANITFDEFKEIIYEQRKRGIVQGQYYIYITPLMLQIHLISEWWETHGIQSEEDFNKLFGNVPPGSIHGLLERFLDQLPYSGATAKGEEFAASIMRSGLFTGMGGEFLKSETGSRFFLKLSEANLPDAMTLLEKTVGNWSDNEIENFTVGRRNVVWALENLVTYEETFIRGAAILLRLAENENESYSNNATGVFASLFTPVSGELSLTEASPSVRLSVLEEAVKSKNTEIRNVAIKACDEGLETRFFSRMIENPIANLRREPRRWTAKTYGEIFDVYQEIWNLLVYMVKNPQNQDEQLNVFKILVKHSIEINRIPSLSELVISTFEELKETKILKNLLLEGIIRFLRYGNANNDPEIRNRWVTLQEGLTGSGYEDLLRRYVGTYIFEEQYDKDANPTNKLKTELTKLVDYSISNQDELIAQLTWLLSKEAINSQFFGYLLGQEDDDLDFLSIIIKNVNDYTNLGLLGGYLRALHEKDAPKWEEQLDRLSENPKFLPKLPEITARSGLSDRALKRIIRLVKTDQLSCESVGILSSFREIQDLSEDTFLEWIQLLLRENVPNNYEIAIRDMNLYFIFEKKDISLPEDLTFSLLTLPFTEEDQDVQNRVMVDYYWQEISKQFISQYPEKQIKLIESILNYYSTNIGLSTLPSAQPYGIMNHILKERPEEAWKLIIKFLDSAESIGEYNIISWLRGEKYTFEREVTLYPITLIPHKLIWEWVNGNISKNAKQIARMVPTELFHNEEKECLSRQVLVRYGKREDVRQALLANFWSDSWSGPASLHYKIKKNEALEFKEGETDINVLKWLDIYISSLESSIKRSLLREERRGY